MLGLRQYVPHVHLIFECVKISETDDLPALLSIVGTSAAGSHPPETRTFYSRSISAARKLNANCLLCQCFAAIVQRMDSLPLILNALIVEIHPVFSPRTVISGIDTVLIADVNPLIPHRTNGDPYSFFSRRVCNMFSGLCSGMLSGCAEELLRLRQSLPISITRRGREAARTLIDGS